MAPRNLLITALVAAGALALVASSVAFAATTMGGWFGGGSSSAPMAGDMASHMSGGMNGMHGSSAAAADQPTVAAAGTQVTIEIVDMAFRPANLQVAPGTTVTWVNKDAAPHTATASDRSWDSGIFNRGESWSRTFDSPGSYDYLCLVHPAMTGTITVGD